MGHEIAAVHFRHFDFHRFERHIAEEMIILHDWFQSQRFSERRGIGGLELEGWIVDVDGLPLPINETMLERLQRPDVVHELSRFNVEFNVDPQPLAGSGLRTLVDELSEVWRRCNQSAAELGASIVAIGILPTLSDDMLTLRNMSPSHRYRALNEQTLRLRQGRPIRLDISGRERLETSHRDVMLEAASTSLQLHLQTPLSEAVRVMNAAAVVSAPMVAVAANSPILFGKQLWDETRIPLCEQAVDVGGGRFGRVTFGSGYVDESLENCFQENVDHYPVLLPLSQDHSSERLPHVRLHNGTIWRWNRPLVGFDDDGTPHLRIEHRVMSAGPTLIDMAANMALYYGLVESLSRQPTPPESLLPFGLVRDNFYTAACLGLDAEITWLDCRRWPLRNLLQEILLPLADAGLARLGVDECDAESWLSVMEQRVATGQTGAVWQRRFVDRHSADFALLTREYRVRQQSGQPVHEWDIA